jgi:predicted CXXCH cytochrome family protein
MKNIKRFLVSIAIALLVAGATYLAAQARERSNTPVQAQQQIDCLVCHSKFNDAWSSGAHGHSMSDIKFSEMWTDQGKPGACLVCHATGYDPASGTRQKDAVSCEACHNPMPPEHSTDPAANLVPVDRTNDLCARCHSDTRFGLEEWQTSTHYKRAMTCTVCHDPHTAALKTVSGMEDKGPSGLCINCHSEVAMNFPYSKHNQAGVSCVDCHLRHFEQQDNQDVHTMPDHSFTASLATCTTCHAEQMHTPADAAISTGDTTISTETTPTIQPKATPTAVATVTDKPSPVSPAGFAGLAGLLGLAGGMVLQPWLEKLYHQVNGKKGVKK